MSKILRNISDWVLGYPPYFQGGNLELRNLLVTEDALFHRTGQIDDPMMPEKIQAIKTHGLLSLEQAEQRLSPELIQTMNEQRAKDKIFGKQLNLNSTDCISTFNYNAYLKSNSRAWMRGQRKDDMDKGSLYYQNYSMSPFVTFKIKKDGLAIDTYDTGSFSVPGELFVKDRIPPENILGVVIPDAQSFKMTPEQIEEAQKTIVKLFTDARWGIDFYSGETGKLLGHNRNKIAEHGIER